MASFGEIDTKKMNLRYSGIFDFDGLYAAIVDWAKNYGYMWHEVDYKHKIPSPAGAKQEWKMEMTKKITDFIQYKITLTPVIYDMKEMEIDVDGKKKCVTSGRMYIEIQGRLNYDWQRRFRGSWWQKRLGKWYVNYIYNKELFNYADQLHYRLLNLHAILKKYFDMQTQKYAYKGYLGEN